MEERKTKKHHKSTIMLLLSTTLLMVSSLLISLTYSSSTYLKRCGEVSSESYTENGRVHGEVFIEWPFSENLVSSYTLRYGSIFRINYTVLPTSFSNVSFEYLPELRHENLTIFSPNPPDFILVPGESYAETFTMVHGTAEDYALLLYKARPLLEGSNATVYWWFEVLKYGEASLPGILFSFGALTVFAIVVSIRIKHKRKTN